MYNLIGDPCGVKILLPPGIIMLPWATRSMKLLSPDMTAVKQKPIK